MIAFVYKAVLTFMTTFLPDFGTRHSLLVKVLWF